ncbi:hypothetical protein BD410DRAFT_835207 [Rickenella mellea]|uniref:Fungal-type protein kinase domain-containing protein n=1 Tax=Rickenella mellea TaxID=50990 RepID=A0A4Y7QJW5_9AGAM|nr:hypothetical protein BD410DRAFT_835207 [Rickenella mellea]
MTSRTQNPACAALGFYSWLHRDISTGAGNMLSYDGRGTLTDLEYINHRTLEETHDVPVRTGTMNFMSTGVTAKRYWYMSKDPETKNAVAEFLKAKTLEDLRANSNIRIRSPPPFRYNPFHDIESMWWTACWFIFSNAIRDAGNNLEEQVKDAYELFPGTLTGGLRATFFMNGSGISTHCASLPAQFYSIGMELDDLRLHLVSRYKEVESHKNIGRIGSLTADSTEIYELFEAVFENLSLEQDTEVRVTPLRVLLGPRWESVSKVRVPVHYRTSWQSSWRYSPWNHYVYPPQTADSRAQAGCKKGGAVQKTTHIQASKGKGEQGKVPPSTNTAKNTGGKKPLEPRRGAKRKAVETGRATEAGRPPGKRRKLAVKPH